MTITTREYTQQQQDIERLKVELVVARSHIVHARLERDVLLKWIITQQDCTYCPLGDCRGLEPSSCAHEILEWMRREAKNM